MYLALQKAKQEGAPDVEVSDELWHRLFKAASDGVVADSIGPVTLLDALKQAFSRK